MKGGSDNLMPTDLTIHCKKNFPVTIARIKKLSNWLLNECGVENHTVSILLVDDREIRDLNRTYRHQDKSTNVLSFPLLSGTDETLTGLPVSELGDIVISLETAVNEARKYNQPIYDRFAWLLTHGLLHLLGFDHEKSGSQAEKMFSKEKKILSKLCNYRRSSMTQLAINVDHVATIRQARGINEPDPVAAAAICELAGASGIVVHLREDRRHIQDRDVRLLRETVKTKLNLEMGANKDIIKFALNLKPDLITLVPENRQELTTEGGLDLLSQKKKIAKVIEKMAKKDIPVSIFIDPDPQQIAIAGEIGATFVELHTGAYCDAQNSVDREKEFTLLTAAAEEAFHAGLRVCAGHGLDYQNAGYVAGLDVIEELSIGHAIISRAVFSGLDLAVRDMLAIVESSSLSL